MDLLVFNMSLAPMVIIAILGYGCDNSIFIFLVAINRRATPTSHTTRNGLKKKYMGC